MILTLESQVRKLQTDAHFNHILDYDKGYQAGKKAMLHLVLEAK